MRLRTTILLVVGVLIIGGAVASTAVQLECNQCGGDGKIECPACEGFGAVYVSIYWGKECPCKGRDPYCPICDGYGAFLPCEVCDGKGGESCPGCGGDGKIGANERLLELLGLK